MIPYGGKLWRVLTLVNLVKNHPIANFSITNILLNDVNTCKLHYTNLSVVVYSNLLCMCLIKLSL